jgi:hypothetical protein
MHWHSATSEICKHNGNQRRLRLIGGQAMTEGYKKSVNVTLLIRHLGPRKTCTHKQTELMLTP